MGCFELAGTEHRKDDSGDDAATRLIALIRSGQLRLDQYDVTSFDLDHASEAIAHAAANAGPFGMTVIEPRRGA